jgi:hypothetical protein
MLHCRFVILLINLQLWEHSVTLHSELERSLDFTKEYLYSPLIEEVALTFPQQFIYFIPIVVVTSTQVLLTLSPVLSREANFVIFLSDFASFDSVLTY